MSPPQLPRQRPIPDIPHPVEIFLPPVFRHNLYLSALHRCDRRLCQRLHLAEPLRRSPRLDNRFAPFAQTDRMCVIAHLFQQSLRLQILHNFLPRFEPVQPRVYPRRRAHLPVVRHHINFSQPVPPPHFKIIRVMRRRNFHRTRSKLPVHHLIRDDRNLPIHQRQQNFLPHQPLVPLILRMHCHRRIAQHRFRTRCRYGYKFLRSRHRIPDVPQMSRPLFVQHFQIAQHRQTVWAPIRQIMSAVNQPFFVQSHEHFPHHPRKLRRKRELLPRPVAALTNRPHLLRDFPAAFFLPLPHPPYELFPPQRAVINPLFGQLLHHHALCRNPRVVRSRQIQRVVPAHPVPPRQNVDFRVVQHMPDVQRSRHVRRRNHDGKHRSLGIRVRAEQSLRHPIFRPARFDLLRFVRFGDFSSHQECISALAGAGLASPLLGPPVSL